LFLQYRALVGRFASPGIVEEIFAASKPGRLAISGSFVNPGIIRTVDMSQELAKSLKSLRMVREIENLKNGWDEVPRSVFVSPRGKLLEESKVRRRFVRALASAGVSSHRLYDLRHTVVTTHLAKETPITWIAQQCGHARPSTTLAWYAHWLPQSGAGYADRLDSCHPIGTNPPRGSESIGVNGEKAA
jgi:integrase